MTDIRPISDLRKKYPEIESAVKEGQAVYLTKNGYGAMAVMSIGAYSKLVENTETALDTADAYAENHTERMTHEQVFRNYEGC